MEEVIEFKLSWFDLMEAWKVRLEKELFEGEK